MRTITISTENSETYSSISNFFIDYYMTDANGEFVKVYLYLIRLLNSQKQISVAEIADHFNLTEKDICRAIKYWVTRDVLRLTFDGKGQPTGIVVLPLREPEISLAAEADAFSLLRSDSGNAEVLPAETHTELKETEAVVNEDSSYSSKIVPIHAAVAELSAPQKPVFTQEDLSKVLKDEDWQDILYQVETLFDKVLSKSDTDSLLYIYNTLGFKVDLFEYLIEYCATMKKKNCRYLEATAIGWYQDGIKTKAQAKEQYALMSSVCRIYYKTLGITRKAPTTIEQEFFKTWTKDYGFGEDMIEEACKRAILNTQNPTIKYVNGILSAWHNEGITDFNGIKQADLAHAKAKSIKKANEPVKKTTGNTFTNFSQSSLSSELDEMEKLFQQEVNGQ